MSPRTAIEVEELTKHFAGGVRALDGVTFTVEEGEVFGYLGRNGAGKSTTVRILTTLLRPTFGTAKVLGHDVSSDPGAVRKVFGAALQDAALDELMTGREHLEMAARLAGLGKVPAVERAAELLESFGLRAAADRIAAGYSGGMRRRLDVAMAMVRRPEVLFLDEPTTGLDPQGRRAVWDLVRDLRDSGSTVFLTTQYLAEADELSGRVAVVHDGRIAAIGTSQELKDRLGTTTVRVRVSAGDELRIGEAVAPNVVEARAGGWLEITVQGGEAAVPNLVRLLSGAGAQVDRLSIHPPSLEDVFVSLTGTQIETSAGGVDDGKITAVRRGLGVPAGPGR
ncbi:MAG: ATP-binding cassette domain-containing protein [Acidimicrobiales bacterium]